MNVSELHAFLETLLTQPGITDAGNLKVVVETSERCLSCDGVVEIEQVVRGFDWHKNELIIIPEKKLVPKESHRDVPKKPNGYLCPECEELLKRGWKYCPACGKAINWS